jgi:hypothetical protein
MKTASKGNLIIFVMNYPVDFQTSSFRVNGDIPYSPTNIISLSRAPISECFSLSLRMPYRIQIILPYATLSLRCIYFLTCQLPLCQHVGCFPNLSLIGGPVSELLSIIPGGCRAFRNCVSGDAESKEARIVQAMTDWFVYYSRRIRGWTEESTLIHVTYLLGD